MLGGSPDEIAERHAWCVGQVDLGPPPTSTLARSRDRRGARSSTRNEVDRLERAREARHAAAQPRRPSPRGAELRGRLGLRCSWSYLPLLPTCFPFGAGGKPREPSHHAHTLVFSRLRSIATVCSKSRSLPGLEFRDQGHSFPDPEGCKYLILEAPPGFEPGFRDLQSC